uniref:Uncharacterized protein n=1 Tax=Oryza barthii TaxID=65489 RepID=A0A0D3GQ55_9ORYZ
MQDPKKKVASKHKLTKEVQAIKKRDYFSMTTRCQPNDILEKMNGLRSRELIEYLMNCLDPNSMCLDHGGCGKLPVTSYDHLTLLPLGPTKEELGLGRKEKISSLSILDRINEGETDDFTMQCIMMILFSKLLALDSSTDITGNVVNMVSKDLEQYKDMTLYKFSPERRKSGKRSTVHGCTAFLMVYYLDNLLCKEITCYFVSKGKGKVAAASENTRKRKHMDEEAAQEATIEGSKEALVLVVTSQAFAEAEQIVCNLQKAQDHLVNVLTSLCTTSGNDNTTQASIDTPPTQANDDLGEEQSKGCVESLAPMHVEDPTHIEARQPCARQQMHIIMPAIAPSPVTNPSPLIMPIEMEKRRPLANPKYTSHFKCASTEPL